MEPSLLREKVLSLIEERKIQLIQIEATLKADTNFFMKVFKITDSITQSFKSQEATLILMRNFYLLGNFLSNTLELPTTNEKIYMMKILMEDFDCFINMNLPFQSKFSINEYSKLSIAPPKTQLAVGKLLDYKKGGILKELIKASKVMVFPENLNYSILITGVCYIVDLIYNTFADKNLSYKECYDNITKIDSILANRFFGAIYENLLKTTNEVLNEEFIKINDILFISDEEKIENFF